ncbi:hypothetical protein DY979_29170 [Pseudomonas aeruginosa]|nr:hypothetical protein DY979_29170 [Pseudomonas aeruginosa]
MGLREQFRERQRRRIEAANLVQQLGRLPAVDGVWGATEQKVHLSPAPARKPLWRLVSSGKPSFCRTIASPFVIGV